MGCSETKEIVNIPTPSYKVDYSNLYKIVLIGSSGTGKTSLMTRFVDSKFEDTFISTVGIDFRVKTVVEENRTLKVQIWDTSGQERFLSITHSYFRGAHGVLIVFDVSNPKSFNQLGKWLEDVEAYCNEDVKIMIIGNKIDLPRAISKTVVEDFCIQYGLDYVETSAKECMNVNLAFDNMIKKIKK